MCHVAGLVQPWASGAGSLSTVMIRVSGTLKANAIDANDANFAWPL